jgi:hypothetical protein
MCSTVYPVHDTTTLDAAFQTLTKDRPEAFMVSASGHAAAAPPSVAKNFRRSMWLAM